MIQPLELRLGNRCTTIDKNGDRPLCVIESINKDGVWLDKIDELVEYEELEPIPITPEWLERLGFGKRIYTEEWTVKNAYVNAVGYDEDIALIEHEDHLGPISGSYEIKDFQIKRFNRKVVIRYVHQLQNLYFALTGEELKIKG